MPPSRYFMSFPPPPIPQCCRSGARPPPPLRHPDGDMCCIRTVLRPPSSGGEGPSLGAAVCWAAFQEQSSHLHQTVQGRFKQLRVGFLPARKPLLLLLLLLHIGMAGGDRAGGLSWRWGRCRSGGGSWQAAGQVWSPGEQMMFPRSVRSRALRGCGGRCVALSTHLHPGQRGVSPGPLL